MKIDRKYYLFTCAVLSLFSSGCSLFKPKIDNTRLFNIGVQRNSDQKIISANKASLQISIDRFPESLNRPYLMTKIGENELKEYPRYRFAMPLKSSILNIIHDRISFGFPKITVYEFPKDISKNIDYTIRVCVDRLDVDEMESRVAFSGYWESFDLKNNKLNRSQFEFYEQFGKKLDRCAEIISKIENVVKNLSYDIVQSIDVTLSKRESAENK